MIDYIRSLLYQQGYQPFDKDKTAVYVREADNLVYIIILSQLCDGIRLAEYQRIQQQVEFLVSSRYQKEAQTLHLVITENGMFDESIMTEIGCLPNIWLAAEDTGRVYVFENQISDFDNLYDILSDGLKEAVMKHKHQLPFSITPVNIGIVCLNILAFLCVIILNKGLYAVYDTDVMLRMGAMSCTTVKAGAWYQIITAMFLHFGLSHLLNNMVLLTYTGCLLEKKIGSFYYLILYFLSGIVGNIASFIYYDYIGEEYIVSAGASGAVFGVIGALFVVLLVNHTKTESMTPKRLLFMIIITIYYGMTTVGINNAAHIGGLFAGIFGGFLLSKISQYGKLK